MIDSAKSVYLGQTKAPVDDPWVAEWLAGTFPVTGPVADHLAALTNSDRDYWIDLDRGAGRILPAVPVYEVVARMAHEPPVRVGIFVDVEDAESCAAQHDESLDRLEDGYRASVRRRALWLPPKAEPGGQRAGPD